MIRFSANIGFLWPQLPITGRIAAAGRAGFRAIEMHWPYDTAKAALVEACRQAGVEVIGLNTPVGDATKGEFGLGALAGREAEFARAVEIALDYAKGLGAPFVHAMAGDADAREPNARGTLVANLRAAADRASADNISLLLEALNSRDRPGYFYHRVEDVISILEAVDRPNVKLMFDIYHLGVAQGDVLARLQRVLPHIGHIQIAAVPSRAEPDEGEIAYDRVLRAIDATGYAGWIGCEYKPRNDTDMGLRWATTLGFPLTTNRGS